MSRHVKALIAWFSSLLLAAGALALPAQAVETPNDGVCDVPGTGTSWAGAFQISTVAQFKELPDCDHATQKRHFILLNNLDLGGSSSPWTPLQGFNGWLDGNSKTISNLFINTPNANLPTGLFGETGELALIQNLFLTVVEVRGKNGVGALAGLWNGGYIEDVTVTAANNSHQLVRAATGYSITSNLLTINLAANHGVKVGAQLATGQFGFGPVIGGRHLTVASVDQVAGTITLPYEASDLAQTSLNASLSIINPLVSGVSDIGGAIGIVTSFSTAGFDGLVQSATAHVVENLSASLSVYGNYMVGGLIGSSYNTNFKSPSFTGSVAAHNPSDSRINSGGLAGYSAEDFWQSASVEATVSSSGAYTGGFFGNNLGRGFPLWCGYGGMPILSLESTSVNVISITYASASDHELAVNDAVAFKGPTGSAYEHGVIGSVAAVNGAVVTIATTVNNPGLLATQAVSGQSSYLLEIQPNSPSNPTCDVGAYDSDFSGAVTGGLYSSTTAAGLVAGYSLANNFKNVTVSGDVFGPGNMVGGLVGWSMRNGFENVVYESGSVLGTDEVGGLVGRALGWTRGMNPTKLSISSQVTINADSISGRDSVGGIAGIATSMTFSNVESSSAIYGYSYAGGLVGKADNSTSIRDSEYSGSWVYGPGGYVGGIAGDISGTEAAVAIAGASSLSASTTRFTTSTRHMLQQGDMVWVKFGSESISKVAEVINVLSTTEVVLDLATDGSYSPASGDVLVELNSIVDTHVTTSLPVGNAGSIRADASYTGGLAGKISNTIVSGSSNALQLRIDPSGNMADVGGLVGQATMSEPHIAFISDSYSTANIYFDGTFANASRIGGLVGNLASVDLFRSFFSGNIFNLPGVAGLSIARIGGLVGRLEDSRITSSYARAELRITNDVPAVEHVGGLVGDQLVTNLSASETALVGSFSTV